MSQQQLYVGAEEPAFTQSLTAIGDCLNAAPSWLADQAARSACLVACAHAEAYSKARSPRASAALAALAVVKHHDALTRFAEELKAVPVLFARDREATRAELERCKKAAETAKVEHSEATGKLLQISRQVSARQAKLQSSHAQASQRLEDAERALNNAVASEDEKAIDAASAALAKARKDIEAATTALASGPEAEVVAAFRSRETAAEAAVVLASQRAADAERELADAVEQSAQVEVDASLVALLDSIVGTWRRIGRWGGGELSVNGADEHRVPLIESGLDALGEILVAPNYSCLEVDLSALSDGNEKKTGGQDIYFDEAATRQANRNSTQIVTPQEDLVPVSRVTYADPDMDPHRMVVRGNG